MQTVNRLMLIALAIAACCSANAARADSRAGATSGIPAANCLTIDGNTGRCIRDGQMPSPPPGVHVGTTSDPSPDCQKTDQNGNCEKADAGPIPGVTSLGTGQHSVPANQTGD